MSGFATTSLGNTNVKISRIGYGAMHLACPASLLGEQVTRVLHHVMERGITMIDTADRYCRDESDPHANERQIAEGLRTYAGDTSEVCVATKGGLLRPHGWWVRYGNPDHIRRTIRESFEALGGEKPLDLWQYHQFDHNFPLEDTLGAVKEAVDEGLIRQVGVSNFNVEELKRARRIVDIVSVQNEYSLWCRGSERSGVVEYCEREGLTFFAWRPLGGKPRAKTLEENATLLQLAQAKDATPQQLALAWLLAKSARIVPIPGSTRLAGVEECVQALNINIDDAELDALQAAIPEERPCVRLTGE